MTLLIVTAYIGATVLQPAPTYAATDDTSSSSMSGMVRGQDSLGDKPPCKGDTMPCKGKLPNCITDIGCIFLVSVPTPDLNFFTTTSWSPVIYPNASEALRGRTIKPAVGPPIPFA